MLFIFSPHYPESVVCSGMLLYYGESQTNNPRLDVAGPAGESQDFGQPRDTGLASTDFGPPGMMLGGWD